MSLSIQSINQLHSKSNSLTRTRNKNLEIGLFESVFSPQIQRALKNSGDFAVVLGANNQTYLILPEVDMLSSENSSGHRFAASA